MVLLRISFTMVGCTQAGIDHSRRASFSGDVILPERDERLQQRATWPVLHPWTAAYLSHAGASRPLTEPDEGMRASREADTSAAAIVKVGGCTRGKYLHPDENTFLDWWSYAEPHKCFSFKDSGAFVCTAIDFWIWESARGSPVPHWSSSYHSSARTHNEVRGGVICDNKRYAKDINRVKVNVWERKVSILRYYSAATA